MKNSETVMPNATVADLLMKRLICCISKASTRVTVFSLASVLLILLFREPLLVLVRYATKTELYSYIPLLPFISAYLLWVERAKFSQFWDYRVPAAAIFGVIGLATFLFCQVEASRDLVRSEADLLSLQALAFVSLIAAASLFLLGKANYKRAAFPVGFLFLIVPFPEAGS